MLSLIYASPTPEQTIVTSPMKVAKDIDSVVGLPRAASR